MRRPRWPIALALALAFLAVAVASTRAPPVQGPDALRASAAALTLSSDGVSPLAVSLAWTRTQDACFGRYTVLSAASSAGPWAPVTTIPDPGVLGFYAAGQVPGATTWWRVDDTDCGAATVSSNVFAVTQPPVAALTATSVGGTYVDLSWTNEAAYGSGLAFVNYLVLESREGGPFAMAAVIASANTTHVHLGKLNLSTPYAFAVNTTDRCLGCASYTPSTTSSNVLAVTTTTGLSVSATQDRIVTDAGLAVTFACGADGGTAPYAYVWSFGDGTGDRGTPVSHAYADAGSVTALCTATDATGAHASQPLAVIVNPPLRVAALAGIEAVSVGEVVPFAANATGGSGRYVFTWDFGDGTTATGVTVTHAYASAGRFAANVTVTDTAGGNASAAVREVQVEGLSVGSLEIGFAAAVGGVGAAIVLLLRRRRRRASEAPRGGRRA